jgi:serine/threonine protein kinase
MGTRVGNYELGKELFSSGPSTFYEAMNTILGNPVRVRRLTLDPERADEMRSRFFREMRHTASLVHPRIPRPLDLFEADGALWSVHDAIYGNPSAQEVANNGFFSLADAARWGAEIADALSFLHARGFVHGRVAPRWIAVAKHGAELLALTKSADLAAGIWPLRPTVNGLSAFSAPEELVGGRSTPSSDTYALAATVVWWLTGQYPAGGATPEEALERAKAGAPGPNLAALRPDAPEALVSALSRAMRREPGERAGTAAALGTVLDETHRRHLAEIPTGFDAGAHLVPEGERTSVTILARHGSGAFGIVFRAKQGDRTVAVKALRPEHRGDRDARERFVREARAMQAVDHENVVRIRGVGEQAGMPYAVMDFVEGPDLATLILREGALPPARAVHLAAGIARGVEGIHRQGIVHRDLKPHNVLVASGDRPVIADFGIARSIAAVRMTMTGAVVGTPAYMAPETFTDAQPSFSADLYAVGAILFEMITGKPPFAGRDAISTIRAIREDPAPRLAAPIPTDLIDVVARLLSKEPAERPANAAGLAAELQALSCRSFAACTEAHFLAPEAAKAQP